MRPGELYFRDQLIAAPLKQQIQMDETGAITYFRDQLIAAPLKLLMPRPDEAHRRRFPRSADRGPIEAVLASTFAISTTYFRDQLIAAPLKQH